jgi:two-component system, chemotaxis family, sensor kinase Cph1
MMSLVYRQLLKANENLEQQVHLRTLELKKELSERTRAEQEIEKTNIELLKSNSELDNFAYIASHDLKEPLRGIHNYSAFLLEDYGDKFDPEAKSKLQTLMRLTQRMEDSRVGRVDLALKEVDLNEVVYNVLHLLEIRLQESNVTVRIPKALPSVYCDKARIGEVFQNLITNAMKYNDKDEKWIEVGVIEEGEKVKELGSRIFYVRDNGIGIREKYFETIFMIFKRLHGRDKFGGGTGAGLTVVKKIIDRHHGHIWVESTYGEGTTFYFTLNMEGENANNGTSTNINC